MESIADYIAFHIQDTVNQVKWNVYAYEGTIQQISLGSSYAYWNKYMSLINYGKSRITYILLAFPNYYCSYKYETTGGDSLDQFGSTVTESERQAIMGVIDNAITYQGNNITSNAYYIQDRMKAVIKGNWAVVIADPNAKYGYHVCRSAGLKWFALRAFKNFKWNYFGSCT